MSVSKKKGEKAKQSSIKRAEKKVFNEDLIEIGDVISDNKETLTETKTPKDAK